MQSIARERQSIAPRPVKVGGFIELMKLRMAVQILFTTFVGYLLGAGDDFRFFILLHVMLGTAMLVIGSFALNQAIEKRFDKLMLRTRARPVPSERVGQTEAFSFGLLCFFAGTGYLYFMVNPLTGILGAAALILYAAVYTPLKRFSSLNTLIGAVPGALPPLMGWTAAQNSLGYGGLVLFFLLFFWQIPHFLALAWMYKDDYTAGGFRMLSVTDPSGAACFRHILLQTLCLILISLFPFVAGIAGPYYLVVALMAGGYFLYTGIVLYRERSREAARRVFMASLLYLPSLLFMLILSKMVL